jgi:hypothetical protein
MYMIFIRNVLVVVRCLTLIRPRSEGVAADRGWFAVASSAPNPDSCPSVSEDDVGLTGPHEDEDHDLVDQDSDEAGERPGADSDQDRHWTLLSLNDQGEEELGEICTLRTIVVNMALRWVWL